MTCDAKTTKREASRCTQGHAVRHAAATGTDDARARAATIAVVGTK